MTVGERERDFGAIGLAHPHLTSVLAALRTALTNGDPETLAGLEPSLAEATAAPPHLPDTAGGRRLAAAPQAYGIRHCRGDHRAAARRCRCPALG